MIQSTTELYQTTIYYNYKNEDSGWYTQNSDTHCAFTSEKEAKKFSIKEIKKQMPQLKKVRNTNEFISKQNSGDEEDYESATFEISKIKIIK